MQNWLSSRLFEQQQSVKCAQVEVLVRKDRDDVSKILYSGANWGNYQLLLEISILRTLYPFSILPSVCTFLSQSMIFLLRS